MYRTQQIIIKNGHKLFNYCNELCFNSKNLYNITNYYIRQVFTGLRKETLTPNEEEALNAINTNITTLNKVKTNYFNRRKASESKKPKEKQKEIKLKLYNELKTKEDYLNFELLDGIFKISNQADYYSLPAQSNQQIMKEAFEAWKSFFKAIKDYKANPSKYKGRPKLPQYASKTGRKTCSLTNQIAVIKDKKYLKLPKTNIKLNVGKLGKIEGSLKETRIVPKGEYFIVELIFEIPENNEIRDLNENKILGIDFGVDNLATIANNIGEPPIIIKGGAIKSINQYYNKQRANYYRILRLGKNPKEGTFTSKKLSKLDTIRFRKIKDLFHKISKTIVDTAYNNGYGTIIIGKNKDFKDNVAMRKADKQIFIGIPYSLLISMIKYKAEAKGIKVIETEESYTSKSSFFDNDILPTYGEETEATYKFSGKRIKRGLYKTKDGYLINADVNGALNIIRKVVPNAFEELWYRGVGFVRTSVSTPLVSLIAR